MPHSFKARLMPSELPSTLSLLGTLLVTMMHPEKIREEPPVICRKRTRRVTLLPRRLLAVAFGQGGQNSGPQAVLDAAALIKTLPHRPQQLSTLQCLSHAIVCASDLQQVSMLHFPSACSWLS
ncbi:hypothetical protein HPB52_021255 [Rhipicephalus sanguineus]|uniref:Uncharacterized protein n=1 Tax=Rhipicephalus sanguineus TaxID=34632 RepID=A0A9D4Q2N4_RHISA|nr:hypothetical protein HPB52_021255 [Rhipicephalus sanguineus]